MTKTDEDEIKEKKPALSKELLALLLMGGAVILLVGLFFSVGAREEIEADTKEEVSQAVSKEEKPVTVEEIVEEPVEVTVVQPSFDLVRVDKEGSAIIAGTAEPNSILTLNADGVELSQTDVGSDGNFVFNLDLPKGSDPLSLALIGEDETVSKETVLVMPVAEEKPVSPKIAIAQDDGEIIVQPEGEVGPVEQPLSLDSINYSEQGDVVLAGRGNDAQAVRVYVDNEPISMSRVEEGAWKFVIPDVEEGIYTLRVDAVDEVGNVTERVESPFQRVIAEMKEGAATIQPGFTLWKLAELKYGSGDRYIQIVEANKDNIKDPNMIFPGQVFEVPE